MNITRPKPGVSNTLQLLFACVVVAFAGTFLFARGTGGDFGDAVVGLIVLAIVGFLLFDANRRLRSVEISPEGISSLKWKRVPGWIPVRLTRVSMPWAEVATVATRGLIVSLRGPSETITVNTYLFDQPREVLALINSYLEGARR